MRFRKGARLDPGQVRDVRGRGIGPMGPVGTLGAGGGDRRHHHHRRRVADERWRWRWRAAWSTRRLEHRHEPRARAGVPDGRGREPIAGLPHRRRREQRAGVLVGDGPRISRSDRRRSSPVRCTPAAAPLRRRSGRSTARPIEACTSTSGSSTSSRSQFGAQGGPFAEAYVIAHEYGHHVQNLLGTTSGRSDGSTGPTSVVGAARAAGRLLCGRVGRQRGRHRVTSSSSPTGRHRGGLDAAAAVGDDRIQQQTQGQVESGSVDARLGRAAAALVHQGYESGDPNACDTFVGVVVVTRTGLSRTSSVEVAGVDAVGQADRQAGDAAGHEVDHTLMTFEHAADPQRR